MVAQQLIDIIIKAEDQASETAKKVDDKLKKMGDTASKANDNATKSTYKFNDALLKVNNSTGVVGSGAAQAANLLGQMKLDPNFGSSIDRAKLSVSQMGYSLDSVRGKFQVIKTVATGPFNTLKGKVTDVANTIRNKFSSAVDNAKAKLQQLSASGHSLGGVGGMLKGMVSQLGGMIGYDLVNGLVNAARASINAASQLEYFGQRLSKAKGETKLTSSEFKKFKTELGDLQKEFRKVDMTAVGATAEELAVKMNLPANKLSDLTRMTAVLSSTFVKEGRSQEDAILAVSDALDGQFKRLQEIGITQDILKENGWNGNLEDQGSLIDAINKSMKEMGYEQTAKDITNLDEAWGALTIAGGQLLQSVLVPITPALISLLEGAIQVADAIQGFVGALGGLPDGAKLAIGLTAVAIAIGAIATAMQVGLIATIPELVAGFTAAAGAAWSFALALLANPVTWIALALVAVAVAVYEVGKAFGWWTDVGSMLDAIWAGIQRLWSAFINHPDVQAIVEALSAAWNALSSAIGGVIDWLGSFFSSSTGGEFDVVRALIDALGTAWEQVTLPIRIIIQLLQMFYNVGAQIGSGQLNLLGVISNVWLSIQSLFNMVLMSIVNSIVSWASNILIQGATAARNFVNGVMNAVKSLPSKFLKILSLVLTYIIARANLWVMQAKRGAQNLVNGVMNYLKTLPSKALSALLGVLHSITSAGAKWVSGVKNQASQVVNGAYNTLKSLPGKVGSALSGVVDRIVKPFRDAYNTAKGWWDKITSLGGGGAAGFDYEGMIEELMQQNGGLSLTSNDSIDVNVSQEIELMFDLKNIPEGTDADTVYRMVEAALNDKNVIKSLVQNNDFQSLDQKVKSRIIAKNNRARGV